jgi:hypothetical protein
MGSRLPIAAPRSRNRGAVRGRRRPVVGRSMRLASLASPASPASHLTTGCGCRRDLGGPPLTVRKLTGRSRPATPGIVAGASSRRVSELARCARPRPRPRCARPTSVPPMPADPTFAPPPHGNLTYAARAGRNGRPRRPGRLVRRCHRRPVCRQAASSVPRSSPANRRLPRRLSARRDPMPPGRATTRATTHLGRPGQSRPGQSRQGRKVPGNRPRGPRGRVRRSLLPSGEVRRALPRQGLATFRLRWNRSTRQANRRPPPAASARRTCPSRRSRRVGSTVRRRARSAQPSPPRTPSRAPPRTRPSQRANQRPERTPDLPPQHALPIPGRQGPCGPGRARQVTSRGAVSKASRRRTPPAPVTNLAPRRRGTATDLPTGR